MVYRLWYANNELVTGANLNQRSHHWGAPFTISKMVIFQFATLNIQTGHGFAIPMDPAVPSERKCNWAMMTSSSGNRRTFSVAMDPLWAWNTNVATGISWEDMGRSAKISRFYKTTMCCFYCVEAQESGRSPVGLLGEALNPWCFIMFYRLVI